MPSKIISRCLLLLSVLPGTTVLATPDEADLDTVTITGQQQDTQREYIENSGLNVEVIDTEEFLNSSKDINQVLNTTPGINIRYSGALGSQFKLSLNGLSDNQIRYFIDGIPMENFGSALSLDNYIINLVERIEVFKGVVPTYLSADALGGAINIVTPTLDRDLVDASYSYGSFNTHRLAFNGQKVNHNDTFFRLSSFFNYSDNDYKMKEVPATDSLGNVTGTKEATRFHDEYRSYMANLRTGFQNKSWADEVALSLTTAANKDNNQHSANSANTPYGKFYTEGETLLSTVDYKKQWQSLYVKFYWLTGESKETYVDKYSRRYQWDGSYTDKNSNVGEVENRQLSVLEIKDEIDRVNLHTKYDISDQTEANLSLAYNKTVRSGKEHLDTLAENIFEEPLKVEKSVYSAGLDHTSALKKLNIGAFFKHYTLNAKAHDENIEDGSPVDPNINDSLSGYGSYIRYDLTSDVRLSTSYEKAYRIPEAVELLGNGKFVQPNTQLNPEETKNLNFGVEYRKFSDNTSVALQANLFYRDAQKFIRYTVRGPTTGIYENIDHVEVKGIELSATFDFDNEYFVNSAATYQNMVSKEDSLAFNISNFQKGDKIPNEPYAFANIRFGKNFFSQDFETLTVSWETNYVHEYFQHWESLGDRDTKKTIDTQLTHNVEASRTFDQGRYNLSLTINNIFDETVYDNYAIQKPGRSAFIKFRFTY